MNENTENTKNAYKASLYDYETGKRLRYATVVELERSIDAARGDNGQGVFLLGTTKVFVV